MRRSSSGTSPEMSSHLSCVTCLGKQEQKTKNKKTASGHNNNLKLNAWQYKNISNYWWHVSSLSQQTVWLIAAGKKKPGVINISNDSIYVSPFLHVCIRRTINGTQPSLVIFHTNYLLVFFCMLKYWTASNCTGVTPYIYIYIYSLFLESKWRWQKDRWESARQTTGKTSCDAVAFETDCYFDFKVHFQSANECCDTVKSA